jgi:hypothetical protein
MDSPESEELKLQKELNRLKEVEFYAASVNGFINTALEHDKSIFTLSAGGIGLLATMMPGISSWSMLVMYGCAIGAFLVSLLIVLSIFSLNRKHILKVLGGNPDPDRWLTVLDVSAKVAFGAGAALTVYIGISGAQASYQDKMEKQMAADSKNTGSTNMAHDSINGLGSVTKSFNNLGAAQPMASTTTTTTTTTTTATTTTAQQSPTASTPPSGK